MSAIEQLCRAMGELRDITKEISAVLTMPMTTSTWSLAPAEIGCHLHAPCHSDAVSAKVGCEPDLVQLVRCESVIPSRWSPSFFALAVWHFITRISESSLREFMKLTIDWRLCLASDTGSSDLAVSAAGPGR